MTLATYIHTACIAVPPVDSAAGLRAPAPRKVVTMPAPSVRSMVVPTPSHGCITAWARRCLVNSSPRRLRRWLRAASVHLVINFFRCDCRQFSPGLPRTYGFPTAGKDSPGAAGAYANKNHGRNSECGLGSGVLVGLAGDWCAGLKAVHEVCWRACHRAGDGG